MRGRRRALRWGAAAVALLALALACASASASVASLRHAVRYNDARDRWRLRAPEHYLLTVASGPGCELQAEVRAERAVRVVRADACLHPARTVSDVFALVDRGQLSEPCFFAGCACHMDVTTDATYDPQYGYPVVVQTRLDRGASWWRLEFWRYLVERGHTPGCARTSASEVARVVDFMPLP